jgi:hypothetical protein
VENPQKTVEKLHNLQFSVENFIPWGRFLRGKKCSGLGTFWKGFLAGILGSRGVER